MLAKKRVTDERIKSELRKKDVFIGEKDFEKAIDNLVSSNKIELRGNDTNKMYFITTHRDDTILVPQTQESDDENSVNENTTEIPKDASNRYETTSQTTRNQAIMGIKELMISLKNYNHSRISIDRLTIS